MSKPAVSKPPKKFIDLDSGDLVWIVRVTSTHDHNERIYYVDYILEASITYNLITNAERGIEGNVGVFVPLPIGLIVENCTYKGDTDQYAVCTDVLYSESGSKAGAIIYWVLPSDASLAHLLKSLIYERDHLDNNFEYSSYTMLRLAMNKLRNMNPLI